MITLARLPVSITAIAAPDADGERAVVSTSRLHRALDR